MASFFKPKGFSPKKSTPRKASSLSNLAAALDITERAKEFGVDYGTTSLKLDGNELKFIDGQWRVGNKLSLWIKHLQRLLDSSLYWVVSDKAKSN